jgi:hypothetical protein
MTEEKKNLMVASSGRKIKKQINNYQKILQQFVDTGTNGDQVNKILESLLDGAHKIQNILDKNPILDKNIYDIFYLSNQVKIMAYNKDYRKNISMEIEKIIENQKNLSYDLKKYIIANNRLFQQLMKAYRRLNFNMNINKKYESQLNNISLMIQQLQIINGLLKQQEIMEDVIEIYWENQYQDKYSLLKKQKILLDQLEKAIEIIEPETIYQKIFNIKKKDKK